MMVASISQAAQTVKIYNWSDYIAPDTLKNFQTETGINTTYEIYDNNETLDEKLRARRSGYDIVVPSSHFMGNQIKRGDLKKLDKSQLPNWKNLNPVLLQALAVNDPGNEHGFPYMWGSTGIGYNVAKVKAVLGQDAPLDSWDLLFKPENMKKLAECGVAIIDSAPDMMPITLNYLGLSPSSENPEDYAKAKAALLAIRPSVRYFNSSNYVRDLADGTVCVAIGYSGDILQARLTAEHANAGVDIRYIIPREGAPMWFDMVAMPTDAPDEKAGYAFMNYLLNPMVIADITNHVHYANGNEKADSLVHAELRIDAQIYPDAETLGSLFPIQPLPADIHAVRLRAWNEIKLAP
jgi:putrescine transport system substrate-binding protein